MRETSPATAALPAGPFFATAPQRLALARERFFEQGVRPSGLVSEAVIQSWLRCLQARHDPARVPEFNPVTASRMHSALARTRLLREAAADEFSQLQATLAGTTGTAILTDAQGVVVVTTFGAARAQEVLMPLCARVGVKLSEQAVGTTAPGITAHTGQASVVQAGEHFFGAVQVMHCAAAPIHDVRGQLAGVLDLSSEHLPFNFDAASVVGLYATAIENRLLCAQSAEHLLVQMQVAAPLLDTPMAGLVGIASDGRVAWLNGVAARLLGLPPQRQAAAALSVEDAFGCDADALSSLARRTDAVATVLPNGLRVWVRTRRPRHDGAARLHQLGSPLPAEASSAGTGAAPSRGSSGTLRQADRDLISQTLETCGGNVSQAARRLGVSRGLIYRHLRAG
jgi:transcriptional regulator of acetoin/glycerol metabolism